VSSFKIYFDEDAIDTDLVAALRSRHVEVVTVPSPWDNHGGYAESGRVSRQLGLTAVTIKCGKIGLPTSIHARLAESQADLEGLIHL
jgi:hypothetical protein